MVCERAKKKPEERLLIGWHFFDIQEKKKQPILKFRKLIYTRGSIHLHRTIGQILRDNISDFNTYVENINYLEGTLNI